MRFVLSWQFAFVVLGYWVRAEEMKVPVKFTGGHEIDRRDGGRPVVLVAAGLGVKPEVFREAFSNVRPAKNGKPSGEEARRNKEVLMKALGPQGITNERLDEVSNYYRYQPQRGNLWPTTAAKAHAVVEDGKVKRIVVDEGGSGYSSQPVATIEGMENVKLKVNLQFGKDWKRNGTVESIEVE
ncbi:MAG TPA: hypothetical protein VGI40_20195, partial [Pirellulaceae bacterium]